MDEKRSVQKKVNKKDELFPCIMNNPVLMKQECQDDFRKATLTIGKKGENCIEVDGEIFELLL
jgi:hypothetical protein